MNKTPAMTMGTAQWAMLVTLSLLWGGTFFFIEVALDDLPPLTLVLLRVALAAVALHVYIFATGRRLPASLRLWGAFAVMGLFNNLVPFSLISWGQTQISGSLASILNATTPIWTVLLAHWLTADEKLTGLRAVGVALGFIGVAVMIGIEALSGLGGALLAQLAVVGAAVCYASTGIYGRRFSGIRPSQVATGQLTMTSVMMLPVALAVDRPWTLPMPSAAAIGAIFGLALASTAVAYILYFRLLATSGAVNLLLVTFLIPISATALGMGLLGETLQAQHLAGMAMIAAGLAAIDGRPVAWLRRRGRL
ncbi:MAG: DMT family transporter [Hyphomicrobiales bacterium]|nr:DMT family transporter [Hyphomicrobiales bacterium]